ncbi:protein kinase [Nocardia sp. CA2R105]|uniref:protein kinase domain-containing protein n=1 Tax=Nocardia coffeae TaxID=2873381 RepID=UPI001CA65B0E|nr:protein kinase [Nocardia coffeae]MBY8863371.1 protein kinase [Nocardia coffeae]
MTDDESLRTRRDVVTPLTAELEAAGFTDAVEIGRGGFGVVYRSRQVALNRMVAVKVLTTDLDADNRARFIREQRAMGLLTGHPNIVTVLEVGATASGQPYLVMPYHRADPLDAWIRKHGPISLGNVLSIGVKIAGALESAHRLDIVHRDVKPGNILLTEYGEPVLTDFGIARIAGEFQTTAGTMTGSPAFIAPEVLEGDTPSPASDVYGLGATLFSALTGHAAFERRSGENVVAQFLRITTQPVPDLRDGGLPDDVAALVATAMNRRPGNRPSAAAFGESIRRVQQRYGFPVEEMALRADSNAEFGDGKASVPVGHLPALDAAPGNGRGRGNLPLELTSFINRRTELAQVKKLLESSRLVTLTGIGGVGKTRLALRAASNERRKFRDGTWLVELSDLSDSSLLVDQIAAILGVRDQPNASLLEVLIRFLSSRKSLLLLDNCEQLVQAVANLTGTLLRSCPDLRILATSREPLNIVGESVVRVPPLTIPDQDREHTLEGLPSFDAVTLFSERAATAVPGFQLDENNKSAVAQICARLDGLPLALELAAARLRSMSPDQILQHLDDRYALLTRGSRAAPTRQQTLRWCVDWSYQLCTSAEQRFWARLTVFAGAFELDAAEQVAGADLSPQDALDVLSSLVDKSILVREEINTVVRFRMLETLREYGRHKLQESGEHQELRRRYCDWYQRLALDAETGWLSDRQPAWIARLDREQPNLREALDALHSDDTAEGAEAALRITAGLYEYWFYRGLYGEGRFLLERALADTDVRSIPARVKALRANTQLAAAHGDFHAAEISLEEARALGELDPLPISQAQIDHADGTLALLRGDLTRACSSLESAVEKLRSQEASGQYAHALTYLGWAYEVRGDLLRADSCCRKLLTITEPSGELIYRCAAFRGMGVAAWQRGDRNVALRLLGTALRLNRRLNSPVSASFMLQSLAWIVADVDAERTAVLLGAANNLWPAASSTTMVQMSPFNRECEHTARCSLGAQKFNKAFQRGCTMSEDAALAFALEEEYAGSTSRSTGKLTNRELQVADLIAQGLTNKQIATKLVISQRTAGGHVEHILTKLGFTSRAQIAAWVVEEARRQT